MDFYHNLITQKSWELLLDLRKNCRFILIGGWAVYLYTQALKSKDIDLVCEYEQLEKLREKFSVSKNERLCKYEAKKESLEIDIYVPFYSNPGLPAEEIKKFGFNLSGFTTVTKEVLSVLKQKALQARGGTVKGKKDLVDLISLFRLKDFNWPDYHRLVSQYHLQDSLEFARQTIKETRKIEELDLNVYQMARLKKKFMPLLGGS